MSDQRTCWFKSSPGQSDTPCLAPCDAAPQTEPPQGSTPRFELLPFAASHAAFIAEWVTSAAELRWLAPSSELPLTAEKVAAWRKPGGHAYVWGDAQATLPAAYAELNPMRDVSDHWWLGHVIVHPRIRGRGLGTTFVRALLDEAFRGLLASRVSLVVFPQNQPAIACYRRAGFREMGEEYHQFGGNGPHFRLLRLEASSGQDSNPAA